MTRRRWRTPLMADTLLAALVFAVWLACLAVIAYIEVHPGGTP